MHEEQPQPEREPEEPKLQPRVWIASLADYNAGRLHGEWVEAHDSEVLREAIKRILEASSQPGAEEWAIFDYDEFAGFKVQEYDGIEQVSRVARGIREHGPAFAAWAQLHDGERSMLDSFEDAYLGEYDSDADWAREVLDGSGIEEILDREVPESLRRYVQVNYSAYALDAQLGGHIHAEPAPNGRWWMFNTNP